MNDRERVLEGIELQRKLLALGSPVVQWTVTEYYRWHYDSVTVFGNVRLGYSVLTVRFEEHEMPDFWMKEPQWFLEQVAEAVKHAILHPDVLSYHTIQGGLTDDDEDDTDGGTDSRGDRLAQGEP